MLKIKIHEKFCKQPAVPVIRKKKKNKVKNSATATATATASIHVFFRIVPVSE